MKTMKHIGYLLMVVFLLFFIASCQEEESIPPGETVEKVVPVYQGMEVSGSIDDILVDAKTTDQVLHVSKMSQLDVFIKESPIDEAIENLVGPIDQNLLSYYAKQDQDIFIKVHLSNPDNYVILSFILNGVFYQSYQFENGSDSENLILKVSSGTIPGVKAYTIDAIKYVDGTEIKDVLFNGDDTIEIGVEYGREPQAVAIVNTIHQSSFEFAIDVFDPSGVIAINGQTLKFMLFDNETESIIYIQDVQVGSSTLSVDRLLINHMYNYAVFTVVDMMDGLGKRIIKMNDGANQTSEAIMFDQLNVTQSSIDFTIIELDEENIGTIDKIEFFQGSVYIKDLLISSSIHIENLLSSRSYSVRVYYTYHDDLNGDAFEYIKTLQVITLSYVVPTHEVGSIQSTSSTIHFELNTIDPDSRNTEISFSIFDGETEIIDATLIDAYTYTNLLPHHTYDIKALYTYDLNDGRGEQTESFTFSYVTLIEPIVVTNIETLNIFGLKVGDNLHLQVTISNPESIPIDALVIHDQVVPLMEGSTPSIALLNYIPDYTGGIYEVDIQEFHYTYEEYHLIQTVSSSVTHKVSILGQMKIIDCYGQEDHLVGLDQANPQLYLELPSDNPYVISSVTLTYGLTTTNQITLMADMIEMINNHLYGLSSIFTSLGANHVTITYISYGFEGYEPMAISFNYQTTVLVLSSLSINPVSSREDFANMQNGRRYQLTNNLDFSGSTWTPKLMTNGWIDGAGYTIEHLTIDTKTTSTDTLYIGLFQSYLGIIKDLHLANVSINVESEGVIYAGGLVGRYLRFISIERCSIQGTMTIKSKQNVYVGGLLGYSNLSPMYLDIHDIYTHVSINVQTTRSAYIGGVIGAIDSLILKFPIQIQRIFSHAVIVATLSDIGMIGGIVGHPYFVDGFKEIILQDVLSSGQITIQYLGSNVQNVQVGALLGSSYISPLNGYCSFNYSIVLNNQLITITTSKASLEMLNNHEFYMNNLKFDAETWDFSDLNYATGIHPTLK